MLAVNHPQLDLLLLLGLLPPGSLVVRPGGVVDEGVLHQRAEHEEDAHPSPNVHRLGVGHGRQGALYGGHGGGHGQEGRHAEVDSCWGLGLKGSRLEDCYYLLTDL